MSSDNLTDNRNYDYSSWINEEREEYGYIAEMIDHSSSVVDLGCGNGSLLQKLIKEKKISAAGVEISPSGVEVCKSKGLKVMLGRIDEPLPFSDNEFDYSICNVTLQMVMFPEVLLSEMKRISKRQIISFPNFGFYKNRFELLLKGRMPASTLFGFKWYNTGHIHLFSNKDFLDLIETVGGLNILKREYIKSSNPLKNLSMKLFPNLFQLITIYLLEKTVD